MRYPEEHRLGLKMNKKKASTYYQIRNTEHFGKGKERCKQVRHTQVLEKRLTLTPEGKRRK